MTSEPAIRSPVTVLGAGGHARVVVASLRDAGFAIAAVVDEDPVKTGATVLGMAVEAFDATSELSGAVIAVGDNRRRAELARRSTRATWVHVVHPTSYVHPTAELGPGTVVFAGAIIQPTVRVGAHAIINTGATIDHDCILEDFVHLAPGVHLAGGVSVGQGTLMGIGSVAAPNVKIGRWATIGAGAVVVSDIPDGVVAVGTPARPVRSNST